MNMKFIFSIIFISIFTQVSADNILVMHIVPPTEYYPFAFAGRQGNGTGLLAELLETVAEKNNIKLVYKVLPRKRAEHALNEGSIDAYATSEKYIEYPSKFVWCDSIIINNDYLYSLLENPVDFHSFEDLFGKRIGTQLGFRYYKIDKYFSSGKIIRDDAINEYQSLKKLLRKRIDSAIINETIGEKLLVVHKKEFADKFFISKEVINSAEMGIAFNRKWSDFVQVLNDEIKIMRKNGQLQVLIDKYIK